MVRITHEKWLEAAAHRYGKSPRNWKFRCPACGHVQSGQDFLDLGVSQERAATQLGFSCIGRSMAAPRSAFDRGQGPCNYTSGGLLRISPVVVQVEGAEDNEVHCFDFADDPLDIHVPEVAAGGAWLESSAAIKGGSA